MRRQGVRRQGACAERHNNKPLALSTGCPNVMLRVLYGLCVFLVRRSDSDSDYSLCVWPFLKTRQNKKHNSMWPAILFVEACGKFAFGLGWKPQVEKPVLCDCLFDAGLA